MIIIIVGSENAINYCVHEEADSANFNRHRNSQEPGSLTLNNHCNGLWADKIFNSLPNRYGRKYLTAQIIANYYFSIVL